MRHHKFNEVLTLVEASQPVLLSGEKGSGKTTLAMQIAEEMELPFYSIGMTRQTTLSHLLGFISVSGAYIPTQLRKAVEEGGVFLTDELDAGDANVILCLNTIENGYISFPDRVVELHENFRLIATCNPQDQHQHYTGRSKLDAATLDRFDEIDIDRDSDLEKSLVDKEVFLHVNMLRSIMAELNCTKVLSMRDSMRFQKRKDLDILGDFIYKVTGKNDLVMSRYKEELSNIPKFTDQAECNSLTDLYDEMRKEASV